MAAGRSRLAIDLDESPIEALAVPGTAGVPSASVRISPLPTMPTVTVITTVTTPTGSNTTVNVDGADKAAAAAAEEGASQLAGPPLNACRRCSARRSAQPAGAVSY
jgi:hypothetical protein